MGHTVKGQTPRQYRPSSTRRASGLSPVNEARENARKRWNKLRQAVKARSQIQRNIRTKGYAKRGRFVEKNSSPTKKKPIGDFVAQHSGRHLLSGSANPKGAVQG
jgi:hypothetical protein